MTCPVRIQNTQINMHIPPLNNSLQDIVFACLRPFLYGKEGKRKEDCSHTQRERESARAGKERERERERERIKVLIGKDAAAVYVQESGLFSKY